MKSSCLDAQVLRMANRMGDRQNVSGLAASQDVTA